VVAAKASGYPHSRCDLASGHAPGTVLRFQQHPRLMADDLGAGSGICDD
jgi:hypothetical protein